MTASGTTILPTLNCGHPATAGNIRMVPHRNGAYRKCRHCVKLAKERAKQHVQQIRAQTICITCGRQPIDWHRVEHEQHPTWRIGHMTARGETIKRIDAEIARCTPLCRRCHMTLDGRIKIAIANVKGSPRPKGEKHHAARLSDAEIADIRQRRKNGERIKDLAIRYAVHPGWVGLVVAGRRR